MDKELIEKDNRQLKGTLRYILRQIELNHSGLLQVIKQNATHALMKCHKVCSSCKGIGLDCNDCGGTGEPFNAFTEGYDIKAALEAKPTDAPDKDGMTKETQQDMPDVIWIKRGGHQEADWVNALPIPGHATSYTRTDSLTAIEAALDKAEGALNASRKALEFIECDSIEIDIREHAKEQADADGEALKEIAALRKHLTTSMGY